MSSFNIFEQAHKAHFHLFLSSLPPPEQMFSNLFSHRANSRFWGELVKCFIGQKPKCKCFSLGQIYKCSQETASKYPNQWRKRVQGKEEAVSSFWPCFPLRGKKSMLLKDTEFPFSSKTINIRTDLTCVEKTCQIYLLYLSSNCFQLCSMAAVSGKLSQK